MSEPKKVDRRKFIYAGLGAVALIAIGAAAYVAMNPPVVTQTVTTATTLPTTSVVTTTVPTTVVTTVTQPTTTVITTTPTVTPLGTISMMAESGWYPQEEEAKRWLVTMFKRETGINVEMVTLTQTDILKKTMAMAMAGNPPDIVYSTGFTGTQDYCWKGWIEDATEFIDDLKKLEVPDWCIKAYTWADSKKRKLILFGVPFLLNNVPMHYWKDFLEKAGMPTNPDEIPTKFSDFSNFWKEAQDRLWEKDPDTKGKVYGIGWPSLGAIGTAPGDGLQQIAHIMLWHGWKLEYDSKGIINIDASGNRDALKKTVGWVVETYKAGYMPKGILTWGPADNNTAFHSRSVISVHNGSMSIPLYWYSQDKTVYFEKTASLTKFPSEDGTRGKQTWQVHPLVIFADAKNKELAKKFIKWFLQPELLNNFYKAIGGRFIPPSKAVLEMDPFYKQGYSDSGKVDPHLPTVYEMYVEGEKLKINVPNIEHWFQFPFGALDAYPMQAVHKVLEEGFTVDEAVNWAMEKWLTVIKSYADEVRSW